MADITVKQNDTWPPVTVTLSDAVGPVDLTTAVTIKMILAPQPTLTPVKTCVMTKNPDQVGQKGKASYTFIASDTSTVAIYNAEFEVDWGSGKIETFPNSGYKTIEVADDLG